MAEGNAPSQPERISKIFINSDGQNIHFATAIQIAVDGHRMRRDLASGILRIFVIGNLALWTLVTTLAAVDVFMTIRVYETARDRVIDRGVVKTIVGATTVQVGIIMVAITTHPTA
jgi:hypothetical protein